MSTLDKEIFADMPDEDSGGLIIPSSRGTKENRSKKPSAEKRASKIAANQAQPAQEPAKKRAKLLKRTIELPNGSKLTQVQTQKPSQLIQTSIAELEETANRLALQSLAKNTVKAYTIDINQYFYWCSENKLGTSGQKDCFTIDNVKLYMSYLFEQNVSVSKINRALSAIDKIADFYGSGGFRKNREISAILKGIYRTSTRKKKRVSAATKDKLEKLVLAALSSKDTTPARAARDVAVLLVNTWGSLRASESSDLQLQDLSVSTDSLNLLIRKSKTDQAGVGATVMLPEIDSKLCPVRALRVWLTVRGTANGFLFCKLSKDKADPGQKLSPEAISEIFKKYGRLAKIEEPITGHSARAGFVTQAAIVGVPIDEIKKQSRHSSIAVLSDYIRRTGAERSPMLKKVFSDQPETTLGSITVSADKLPNVTAIKEIFASSQSTSEQKD